MRAVVGFNLAVDFWFRSSDLRRPSPKQRPPPPNATLSVIDQIRFKKRALDAPRAPFACHDLPCIDTKNYNIFAWGKLYKYKKNLNGVFLSVYQLNVLNRRPQCAPDARKSGRIHIWVLLEELRPLDQCIPESFLRSRLPTTAKMCDIKREPQQLILALYWNWKEGPLV